MYTVSIATMVRLTWVKQYIVQVIMWDWDVPVGGWLDAICKKDITYRDEQFCSPGYHHFLVVNAVRIDSIAKLRLI